VDLTWPDSEKGLKKKKYPPKIEVSEEEVQRQIKIPL
jgi:hypothetical protein